MRIVLIDPATRFATIELYENLGLAYLAAMLRQHGHEVRIISTAHENLSRAKTIQIALQMKPELIGVTVLGANARRAVDLVHRLRENGYRGHITLGGYYPTFHALELMRGFPAIDSVVRNEGELTMLDLVEHLPEGDFGKVLGLTYRDGATVKETAQRPFTKTMDELPFPARDFTPHVLRLGGYIHLSTSRGCYANCSFCSIAKFFRMGNGKVWRRRSAENVAEEVDLLTKRFNYNRFKFIDDQFLLTQKEGHEFADIFAKELERRNLKIHFQIACRANNIERDLFTKLKALGLQKVFVGVESGHQRGLDTFDKETTVEMNNQALATLRELGLRYDMGFILVDAYTTYDELKQNLLYLLEHKALLPRPGSYLSVTTSLVAYGGTPIYDHLVSERRLLGDYFNGFYYTIEDKVLGHYVFPVFRRLLFLRRDLRIFYRKRFHRKPTPPNHIMKGGETRENTRLVGLRYAHAAGVE